MVSGSQVSQKNVQILNIMRLGLELVMVWGMCCIRYDGDRCLKCEYFNMLISGDPDHYQTWTRLVVNWAKLSFVF